MIAAKTFSLFVSVGIPVLILAVLLVKNRRLAFSYGLGATTFVVSQVLTRLPLMNQIMSLPDTVAFNLRHPALFSLLIGLSAGMFEECGRYVAMSFAKKHHGFADALSFGAGHGGIEAFLIGLSLLLSPANQQNPIPILIALCGIERLLAMLFHIGLSVVVMHSVAHRQPLWLGLAILLHTLADAAIGIFPLLGLGVVAIEVNFAVFAAISCLLAYRLRTAFLSNTMKEGYSYEKTS